MMEEGGCSVCVEYLLKTREMFALPEKDKKSVDRITPKTPPAFLQTCLM
jgi:hypothetical protein